VPERLSQAAFPRARLVVQNAEASVATAVWSTQQSKVKVKARSSMRVSEVFNCGYGHHHNGHNRYEGREHRSHHEHHGEHHSHKKRHSHHCGHEHHKDC
jgi:hypothetical protein